MRVSYLSVSHLLLQWHMARSVMSCSGIKRHYYLVFVFEVCPRATMYIILRNNVWKILEHFLFLKLHFRVWETIGFLNLALKVFNCFCSDNSYQTLPHHSPSMEEFSFEYIITLEVRTYTTLLITLSFPNNIKKILWKLGSVIVLASHRVEVCYFSYQNVQKCPIFCSHNPFRRRKHNQQQNHQTEILIGNECVQSLLYNRVHLLWYLDMAIWPAYQCQ